MNKGWGTHPIKFNAMYQINWANSSGNLVYRWMGRRTDGQTTDWQAHSYSPPPPPQYHCGRLTHRGRVTHMWVGKLTIIGSDNGLSPRRHQAIIWTNVGILLIGPLRTNFSEILIRIQIFSFKKMHFKMSICEMVSILFRAQFVNKQCTVSSLTPNILISYSKIFGMVYWL